MIRYPINRVAIWSLLVPVLLSESGEEGVICGELIVGIVLRDRGRGGTPGYRGRQVRCRTRLILGYPGPSVPFQPQKPGPSRDQYDREQRPLQRVPKVLPAAGG
jgi:hypothetical protein